MKYELLAWDVVSARLMWASIKHRNGCVVVYVVGHAPTDGSRDAAAFYDELSGVVAGKTAKYEGAEVVVFLDANGKLGSVQSQFIGKCEPDIE
eukprot:4569504-Alexandrium_andersonii.AAC.1